MAPGWLRVSRTAFDQSRKLLAGLGILGGGRRSSGTAIQQALGNSLNEFSPCPAGTPPRGHAFCRLEFVG